MNTHTSSASAERPWLATCARGLAPLLCEELSALGAVAVKEQGSGVSFRGTRALLYRSCLWSRLASRFLMPLVEGQAADADALYRLLRDIDWAALFAERATLAVDFSGTNESIRDTRFGAQRSKDAIVDALRDAGRERPRIDIKGADLRVSVRLKGDRVDVALDLVGASLHRRGYRQGSGTAPMKENLAAAVLMRADWPAMAASGDALIDPLCGSGTLLIEAAWMAADRAPALARERFAFEAWRGHDETQWQMIRSEARGRAERGLAVELPEIRGYDEDPRVIRRAQENIAAAELSRQVRVSVKSLRELRRPTHRPLPRGLLVCNPPYGQRLGSSEGVLPLYRHLGELLHREFSGWQAAILAGNRDQGRATGLRSHRQYALYNGQLPVTLLLFDLKDNRLSDAPAERPASPPDSPPAQADPGSPPVQSPSEPPPGPGAVMFANRLRKNQRRLQRWLRKSGETCYRLYDADMPEYAVAVDRYEDWLHVAEYRAPASVDAEAAAERLRQLMSVLPEVTGVPEERIVLKRRERQRGSAQYQRRDGRNEVLSVNEGQARLLVNLHDYLDTGLFLDHRALRRRIGIEARDKRFLNLFCYTGAATVHAAIGGARSTTSVDLSNTYLDWLRRNLAHNGLGESRHQIVRDDCLPWLRQQEARFDLIFLDPPSFSNSSRMDASFDVQRDHPDLIDAALACLAPGGVLYFSTNRRKFRLDEALARRAAAVDVTAETLDPDFSRDPPAHRCWRFSRSEK